MEEQDFTPFFEKPYTPFKSMSRSELEDELQRWRNMWTWIPSDVQWWITHTRQLCRFVRRDFQRHEGLLGVCRWELKTIDVDVVSRDYDYATGKATYEEKTVTVPINQLVDFSLIWNKEERRETIDGQEPVEESIPDFEPISVR